MKAQRARRLFAASAIGVLMAGGATIGAAGTASAAVPPKAHTNFGCFDWGFNRCGFGFNNGFGFGNGGVVVVVVN
ncbi:hypothetical protein ACFY0F_03650 [Streptomyces sp. NPDC001544]|uniref:hypothetical protein n=1 Tax=Streptomyces sp. NPDC001544 TaxID=3364584 RepID=UPI00369D755E